MDIIRQITISEVILLFNVAFVLPGVAFLLLKLRKYESTFGSLPDEAKKKKQQKKEPEPQALDLAGNAARINQDVFPYKAKPLLSTADKACLSALEDALGEGVRIFPKVALWETMDVMDKEPGYRDRLNGRDFDFLVCDRATGQVLTAVMYRPVKGPAIAKSDEMKKICAAAGANLIFIEQAEEYDPVSLKGELGIVDLDLGNL